MQSRSNDPVAWNIFPYALDEYIKSIADGVPRMNDENRNLQASFNLRNVNKQVERQE